MDITGIRLTNYNRLLREFAAKEEREGIVKHGFLTRFSDASGISREYLSQVNNGRKQLGRKLARKLELAFGYPEGWMDNVNTESDAPPTDPEAQFVATALHLYRECPTDVQNLLMRYMVEKLATRPKPNNEQHRGP